MDSADIGGIISSRFNSCDRLVVGVLRHAGGFDLLAQLVEFGLLILLAQFLLDRLDLLVEVVLFLGPLHLALHAILNGSVHMELFDFDVQHFRQPLAALDRVEDLDQLLLFFDGDRQVGANDVGDSSKVVDPNGCQQLVPVQVLIELDVLLKLLRDPLARRRRSR